jgi:hypothetical protein
MMPQKEARRKSTRSSQEASRKHPPYNFLYLNRSKRKPVLIFNRENLQNFRFQNGLRRGLDFIALLIGDSFCEIIDSFSYTLKYYCT